MFRNRGKEKIKSIIAMLMTVIMTVAVLADAGVGSARTVFADTADAIVKSIKAVVSDGTGTTVEKEVVKDGSDNFLYINKNDADIKVTINPDIAQNKGATQIRIGSDIKPIENDNDTLTFPITSLSNGTNTINVEAIDNAAVPNVKKTYTLKVIVDDTDPIINSAKVYKDYDGNLVEITDDIWMNAQPIIKIEAEDTDSGVDINSIKCDYYKPNTDGEEHVEGVTTTVTEESGSYKVITAGLESGEYTLKITLNDKAGNTAGSTTLNVKYDNENPAISDVKIEGLVDEGYVKPDNGKITVTAKVADNYSGVKQVKINNIESVYQSDINAYKADIDVPADGKVTVVANDNAGNSIDSQISNIKKDVTSPIVDDVKVTNNTAEVNGITYVQTVNGKIKVTAKVTDDESGIKKVKINDVEAKNSDNTYSAEIAVPDDGKIKVTAIDNAGNEYVPGEAQLKNLKADITAPTVENINITNDNSKLGEITYVKTVNGKIKVTANVTDTDSGVKEVKVNDSTLMTNVEGNLYQAEVPIPENGEIKITAVDCVGNRNYVGEAQIKGVKEDITAPTVENINITNDKSKLGETTYVKTVNGKITVKANVTDTDSGVKEVKVNDSTLMTNVEENLYQAEVPIPENGEIKITAVDCVGNRYYVGEAQIKGVKEDIIAPTVSITITTVDSGFIGTKEASMYIVNGLGQLAYRIEASDDKSGVGHTYYYVGEKKDNIECKDITKENSNGNSIEFPSPQNGIVYYIYAYSVDKVGNTSGIVVSDGTMIDTKAPEIKISETNYFINSDKRIEFSVIDTENNLKTVEINGNIVAASEDSKYSFDSTAENEGKKSYHVTATDKAGNISEKDITVTVDMTAPVISDLEYTPGTKWTKETGDITFSYDDVKADGVDEISGIEDGTPSATYTIDGEKKHLNVQIINGVYAIEASELPEGSYTVTVTGQDRAGNAAESKTVEIRKDLTAPVISDLEYTPGAEWTNESGNITFTYEDPANTNEISGIEDGTPSVTYTMDGVDKKLEMISDGNRYTVEAGELPEGSYTVTITGYDKAGNEAIAQSIEIKKDLTAPVISDLSYAPGEEWTNKIGDITFTYADVNGANEISGIKDGTPKATYDINGETKELEVLQDGESYVIKADNLPEGSYLVTVTGQDFAGNNAEAKSIRIKKDVTNPAILEVEYTPGTEWTNESGDITFKFSDKPVGTTANEISGINESTLRAFYKVNNIESEIEITGSNGTYRIAYDKLPEGSYTVYISGNDMVGNKAETQSMSIKKDITKPVISNISYEPGTSWTNKTGDIQFEIADPQTDKVNQVSGVKTESVEVTYKVGNIERILKVGSGIAEANGKYVIDKADLYEGSYTVKINCVDIAGNKAVSKTINIKKDTTVPSGTIALDGYNKENPWNTLLKNAKYGIFQRKVNSKFASFTVTYKDEEAKDNHSGTVSGVKNAEYIIANSKKTQKELSEINKWEIVSNNIIEIPDAMYAIVYVKITDNAGNIKYISSDGVVFDDTKPMGTLEVKNYTAAQNDIFNEDVVIKYSIDDSVKNAVVTSAIKEYKIVVSDETNSSKSTILSEKIADANYSAAESVNFIGNNISRFTGEVTINSKDYNSNKITVTLSATDNAGNEMEVVKKEIMIDVSAPEVNISYDNNKIGGYDTYFDAGRTMNIVVTERNFNEKDFKLAITKNGVTQIIDGSRLGGWTYVKGTEANGDGDVHSAHYSFNDDADYEIEAEFTDKAGNICKKVIYTGAAVQKFTVDKTKPVINVVSPEGYTSQLVDIPITINEHNFEPSDVNVFVSKTLDGKSEYVDKPVSLIWSDNGDIHSSVLAVGEDGDYTFTVSFKDKAGNNADNYTSAKFSVDNVDPELWCNISAENKNLANKGNIEFQYVYTDVNAESNLISYKVSTLSGEEVAWEPEITEYSEDGKHGYKLVFTDAVDSTKLGDGIYVISVTVKDKANRMATDTKTVSVNRHGSTYDFYDNSYIAQINGGYVKNVEQNIEVRVQNYDEITQYQVSIFNSLNEQIILKEGTDFSWELSDESTDGCKIYTCIINKSIFEENGTYTVQISAKDSADDSMYGDKASMITNKDADNGKVISFTVDDIAPEIAISGVKDGENYDNATDIKLDYSDANKIDSITVQRVSDTGDIIDSYEVSNEDIETAGEKIGRITYTAQEYNDWQTVKFAVTDIAGNTANAEVRILVTSNGWIKFVNNKPLFIGSIVGLVVLLGVIAFVIIYNKKKKTTK